MRQTTTRSDNRKPGLDSFSIVWKKWPVFSTVWKNIFHSMEKSPKSFPYCGKLGLRQHVRYTYNMGGPGIGGGVPSAGFRHTGRGIKISA